MSLTRAISNLGPELEGLSERVIAWCLQVHRELGPGLSESVYQRACRIELEYAQLAVQVEKPVPIRYRGQGIRRVALFVFFAPS